MLLMGSDSVCPYRSDLLYSHDTTKEAIKMYISKHSPCIFHGVRVVVVRALLSLIASNVIIITTVCTITIAFQSVSSNVHYNDVIMGAMASQITSFTIVYSTFYSGSDQRKHQSSALLAFVWEIHRWPVNSRHKWPVTRKMFPFDDVIMFTHVLYQLLACHQQDNWSKPTSIWLGHQRFMLFNW